MQCSEIQEALLEAQYNSKSLPPQAQNHILSCSHCQTLQNSSQSLDAFLELDREPPVLRPGFDTRFYAKLEELKQTKTDSRIESFIRKFQWWFAGAMAGATALVLVTLNQPEMQDPTLFDPDLSLAMELELVEDLDLLAQLEELEDFDVITQLNSLELDTLGDPVAPKPTKKDEVRIQ